MFLNFQKFENALSEIVNLEEEQERQRMNKVMVRVLDAEEYSQMDDTPIEELFTVAMTMGSLLQERQLAFAYVGRIFSGMLRAKRICRARLL